ncbi:DUF1656 domain-containing protein [Hyphomicrobium sp. 99]|uniref:DUF1656 domain-containing protein n=1 Tax=Hyphomicrobium sp. 99 TaxID=1163419 RepID=UPI0005F80112|nr:DUF1656 domain-containing protein [Hyphomicrobium sp. 99]
MVDEVQIFGVYFPAALVWAALAATLAYVIRPLIARMPLRHVNSHMGILDIAVFVTFWWGLSILADAHVLPREFPLQ